VIGFAWEEIMFARHKGTVIAEGLKIVGSVTAEGLVEVNGQIDGDLHCTSLVVSPKAWIKGGVRAERVVVNGRVEGPINGREVVLKSCAIVAGDIESESLAIERGAHFEGHSRRFSESNMPQLDDRAGTKHRKTDEWMGKSGPTPPKSGDIQPVVKHVA
jgi:cytoskeletal protein CcmA (bactofilin family)